MDLKQIEKLMAAMNRQGMRRIYLKEEGMEIELEGISADHPHPHPYPHETLAAHPMRALPSMPTEKVEAIVETKESKYITSPMVGTFYAAPSPDDPAYVKEGDRVDAGTIVCIIEAMKVMNEVKAGLSGTIGEVLLRSGDPVEFGTKIIRLA